jgi:hypothetical protein
MERESKVHSRNFKVKNNPRKRKSCFVLQIATFHLHFSIFEFRISNFALLHSILLPLLQERFTADAQNLRRLRNMKPCGFQSLHDGIAFKLLKRT